MGAKHAKWFVTSAKTTGWLRETELVPKTQGIVESDQADALRHALARVGQGAAAVPAARRQGREGGALDCLSSCSEQGASGYDGIVQGERALAKLAHGHVEGERDPYGEGSFPRPFIAGGGRSRMGATTQ